MSRLRLCMLAIVAMCALSAVAASTATAEKCPVKGESKCLALIHVLSTEKFPLLLEAVTKGKESSFLQAANGAKLSAEELKLLLEVTALGSTGTFDAHFVNVIENGAEEEKKCFTVGDEKVAPANGVVLVKGSFNLVYGSTEPLNLLILLKVSPFEIVCKNKGGETKIKVEGELLGELKPGASGEDVVTLGSNTKCSKTAGVPEITKYLNDNEESVTVSLKSSLGGKLQQSCENVVANPFTANIAKGSVATMATVLW